MQVALANLCGPPLTVEADITPISHIDFFWYKNRMCEKKSGMLICSGSKGECIFKTQRLFMKYGTKRLKKYFSEVPTASQLYDIRKQLLDLHSRYRRLTRKKLPRMLNKKSLAGDLFVADFPEESSARVRKILLQIQEIQTRRKNHDI